MQDVRDDLSTSVDVAGRKVIRDEVGQRHQQLGIDVRFEVDAGYHLFLNERFLNLIRLYMTGGYMRFRYRY